MVLAIAGVLQAQSLGHWESQRGYAEEGTAARSGNARLQASAESVSRPDGEQVFSQWGPTYAGVTVGPQFPPPNLEDNYVQASLDAADRGGGSDGALPYVWSDPEVPEPELAPVLAPVPVATVQAASVGQLSSDEVRAVLRGAGAPEEWVEPLVAIGWCESKHRADAVGDNGNSLGPWQMWSGWAKPMGYAIADLFDWHKAARTAIYIRETRGRFGGPGGWTCADLLGIY